MLDEMTNQAVIGYVLTNEDSTEMEFELADRLDGAMTEVSILVAERAQMLCQLQERLKDTCDDA